MVRMRDSPLDTLDRNRKTFLHSLVDGIGKADAGADFYLSAINSERRGYTLSTDDETLVKMFHSVMKEEWDYGQDYTGVEDFSAEVNQDSSVQDSGAKPEGIAYDHYSGQELLGGAYDSERVIQPNSDQSLTGRTIEMAQGEVNKDPYHSHNYFDYRFNPLYRNSQTGHAPEKLRLLRDFYLADSPEGQSRSQIDGNKEMAWEDYYGDPTNEEYNFVRKPAHYGKLDRTNHDLYEQHFARWRSGNDTLVRNIESQLEGKSRDEIEHVLRQMHMDDAMDGWMSGEKNENGRPKGLGTLDYMLGLEWLDPDQRHEVYEHLRKHGAGDKLRKSIGDRTISVPRVKRNFHQRFSGMYNHWVRAPHMPGESIKFKPKPINAGKAPSLESNLAAFDKVPGSYDRVINYMESLRGKPIDGLPYLSGNKFGFMDKGKGRGFNRNTLMAMLNVDPKTGEFYPDGEHGIYGEAWNSNDNPLTQEEVNKILGHLDVLQKQDNIGRLARNASHWHYGTYLDPDHYPAELTTGKDGEIEHDTLSTHWQRPYLGRGGMGKPPNALFDLIHQHSLIFGDNELLTGMETTSLEDDKQEAADNIYDTTFENIDRKEKPTPSQNVTSDDYGNQHSLFFAKRNSPAVIGIRHQRDSTGETLNSGMNSMLAPFGQPEHELTSAVHGAGRGRHGERGKVYTDVDKGAIHDSESNLNPWNPWYSGRGSRRTTERHSASVHGPFHNESNKGHYDNFATDDKVTAHHHNNLRGYTSGTLPADNPFLGKGGVFDWERTRRKMAHHFHRIGSKLHMARPVLSPGSGIQDINHTDAKNTVASSDQIHNLQYERESERPDEGHYQELMNQMLDLQMQFKELAESPENEQHAQHLLHWATEIEDQLAELEHEDMEHRQGEGALMVPGSGGTLPGGLGKPSKVLDDTENVKFKADLGAINEAGTMMKDAVESQFPGQFDPSLPPEVIDANIRQLARMANDFLNIAPHETHGIHTLGVGRHSQVREMASGDRASGIKGLVHQSPNSIGIQDSAEDVADMLGLDYSEPHAQMTVDSLLQRVKQMLIERQDASIKFPVMTLAQVLGGGEHYGKFSGDLRQQALDLATNKPDRNESLLNATRAANTELSAYDPSVGGRGRTGKVGVGEQMADLGLHWHTAHNADPRQEETTTTPSRAGKKQGKRAQKQSHAHRTLQNLNSIIMSDPNVEPHDVGDVEAEYLGLGKVPIDRFGPDSYSVHNFYNSDGFNHEFGDQEEVSPTFDYNIRPDGTVDVFHIPEGHNVNLTQPLQEFYDTVAPEELKGILHGQASKDLFSLVRQGPQFKVTEDEVYQRNLDNTSVSKSDINLASLTNPDIIRKELGKDIPLLQPMHRIFELEDLECLRGFTGDWLVSILPDGERGFIKKEGDKVSSPSFKLSKEDKKNFKEVSEEDFHVDVIKTEDGYYIFDVIEFAEKEVHSALLNERIKVLRGGMEGIENIHVPSASDTRLTDDAGLQITVEDLQEEDNILLLRDANSTYMVGEMRHPKWVLLNPGNDVVLVVLERRGNGPYTYRLGTGPITQEEGLGTRAVEMKGETYMDMGAAFDSPEKYNEGDHVRVNVANVAESETSNGQKLYNVSGSDIESEAEGEALVSQETLGILAKSEDEQWLCEVYRASSGIRITMPQGDVVYKCTQRGENWTVHSPLAPSHYLIRLSESQRQYWSPVAGAMLKAGLDVAERIESVEPAKPLLKPKKVKGTDWWNKEQKQKVLVKGLKTIERMLKSGVGSVGQSSTGAQGLGIGYATPIESPTGPTNLHDAKTMPDYDNRKLPGVDSTIEPETEDSKPPKHMVIPVEGGQLEVTEDSATLRT